MSQKTYFRKFTNTALTFLIIFTIIALWIFQQYVLPIDNNKTLTTIILANRSMNNLKNTNDYRQYLSNHPKLYKRFNQIGNDTVIHDNPMFDDQCRNALIYKEHIDINTLLRNNCKFCKQRYTKQNNIIWSRELLNAIQQQYLYYDQSESIRVPYPDAFITKKHFKINTNISKLLPTYYMIAKCGSSSIYSNMGKLFNIETIVQKPFKIRYAGQSHKVHTNCGFTFVRNPISRLISGYYTINRKIWKIAKSFNHTLFYNERWNNKDYAGRGWNFLRVYNEPQRFIAFVEELVSNSYKFSHIFPMDHITSIMAKSFSVFFGSDIQFIGKIEYFEDHWKQLMSYCPWFHEHIIVYNGTEMDLNHSVHAMWEFGRSSHWSEYNEILGVNDSNILELAYYIVANNQSLYDQLVNYYWQDFICFGYEPNFDTFKQYVNNYK